MKEIKRKEDSVYLFILIYAILLLFSGFYFFENSAIFAIAITLVFIIIGHNGEISLKKYTILLYVVIAFIMIISELINIYTYNLYSMNIELLFYKLARLLIPLLLANVTQIENFKTKYSDCIYVISIFSLITYITFMLFPNLIVKLPTLVNSRGNKGYFAIFSIVSNFINTGAHRNQGIFWEPGAFQVFIILAIIFEFQKETKMSKNKLIVYVLSIITTFSTTGIICLILLLMVKYLEKTDFTKFFRIISIILIAFIAIKFIFPKLEGFWKYTLVSKIDMIYNYNVSDNNAVSSRVESIYIPLKEYIKSPVIGIGTSGYNKISKDVKHSMFTCTPINIFVKYGMFYGGIMFYGLSYFFGINKKSKIQNMLYMMIYMISVSTEAFQEDIIMLTMVFIGYIMYAKEKEEKNESYCN